MKCPVKDCINQCSDDDGWFLCADHWKIVPDNVKDEVYTALLDCVQQANGQYFLKDDLALRIRLFQARQKALKCAESMVPA